MLRVNPSKYPMQEEVTCRVSVPENKIAIVFDPINNEKLAIIKKIICDLTANSFDLLCDVNVELDGKNEITLIFDSQHAKGIMNFLQELSGTALNLKKEDVSKALNFLYENFAICSHGACMR